MLVLVKIWCVEKCIANLKIEHAIAFKRSAYNIFLEMWLNKISSWKYQELIYSLAWNYYYNSYIYYKFF